jgi:hypothetical protein
VRHGPTSALPAHSLFGGAHACAGRPKRTLGMEQRGMEQTQKRNTKNIIQKKTKGTIQNSKKRSKKEKQAVSAF